MPDGRFDEAIRSLLGPERVTRHAPLAPLTTFRVGGPADWLVEIRSADELSHVLTLAAGHGVPITLLGGGSNVIVADRGVRGVVVRLQLVRIEQPATGTVRAEAGVTMNGLVRFTIGRGLAGLEAWAGTPGTVGGAIFGNAHWGGRNVGDLVRRVMLVSRAGVSEVVGGSRMEFAYDASRLQRTGEILVWAEFGVSAGDPATLRARARESLAFRKRTQPLAMPSAGCIFRNPDPGHDPLPPGVPASAGALIDRAGMKGYRVGGAVVSDRHANFIVNDGGATAADIEAVIAAAREAVRRKYGVTLRDEVVRVGRS